MSEDENDDGLRKQFQNEIDFLFELRVLLTRYDVDIVAVDDKESPALPLVQVQFNQPYGVYEFPVITSVDEDEFDVDFKV